MDKSGRKIKVAHVVTLLELGGAQQNTLYTLQHLDRDRFEPVLICGRGALLDKEAERAGCRVLFIDSLVREIRPLQDWRALGDLRRALERENPDIVHTHSSKAGILGRWAARRAGVPVIIHTFHGFGFNKEQKPWTRAAFVALEKSAAKISRALVAVSRANRDEALALGIGRPEQYRLIRSGVRLADYKSIERSRRAPAGIPLAPDQPLITTVGPFKPQKNLLDFIRAAEIVHRTRPAARFLLVGDGALRPELEGEIRRRGLNGVVILAGWRRDLSAIFSRTDVFVMTSLWEGLPRALVEAMSAGLPSVANAVDGVSDIIEDGVNGFAVEPKRPEKTAERIVYFLKHPEVARTLGEKACASIGEEFDIDRMVRQQEGLYGELMRDVPPQ